MDHGNAQKNADRIRDTTRRSTIRTPAIPQAGGREERLTERPP
jgi:hypothetical protein